MNKEKLIIGYVGNGRSTNRYHLPVVLQRNETIEVKRIYSFDRSLDIWDEIDGILYTDNLDDLLTDDEIQVIIVATPASTHFDLAKKVLNANKHCVVEKPFTTNSSEAKELFALAKEKNLILQSYQNRRFDSDYLTMKKMIDSKKLGDILEVEMHWDYYRPNVPESVKQHHINNAYLYEIGCHTLDQVIAYFGKPDHIYYDVRQLLGKGRMNDYFDIDLYYGITKVSVKSSYFRVKSRPSFVVYGKKGMFVKEGKDRQEEHLKLFYMPDNDDFGIDLPVHYGTLIYYDDEGVYHEEKVISEVGDHGRFYDALYETIVHHVEPLVKPEQVLLQIEILENGLKELK